MLHQPSLLPVAKVDQPTLSPPGAEAVASAP